MHMSCATWCEDQGGIYEIEAASIDNETDGQTSSREKKGLPTNKNSVQRQKWTDIQQRRRAYVQRQLLEQRKLVETTKQMDRHSVEKGLPTYRGSL